MKEAEYFRQAFNDVDYRREKIAELRYHKKFTLGVLIFGVVVFAVMTIAQGLSEGKWMTGIGTSLSSITLMAWVYTNTSTRLAALEAMDGKAPERSPAPAVAGS